MKKTTLLIILFSLPRLALAFTTTGFANPFGVAIDPASGYIYVSNVNGSLDAKLDNGYISRLKADGSVEQMRFINGADQGVELNAPKGMAIIGEQLYVADIDVLRVFHLGTGRVLTPVKFDSKELKHLYDVLNVFPHECQNSHYPV